ncbi:MAG: hypothetical protein D6800_09410, partial [Candidatus Zixiibacteriota bacterium]
MRRRRRKIEDKENLERWLLTYSDLITLLLAFFVVMYSMSRIDAKQFGKMTDALNYILKGGTQIVDKGGEKDPKGHGLLKLGNLNMIQRRINERFKKLGRHEELQTEITERGLVIHIMESALFPQGSAKLQPRAREILDLVAEQIKPLPNHIRIEGHTDNTPIQTALYPSNWELSVARTTEVVRYFTDYHDIAPN